MLGKRATTCGVLVVIALPAKPHELQINIQAGCSTQTMRAKHSCAIFSHIATFLAKTREELADTLTSDCITLNWPPDKDPGFGKLLGMAYNTDETTRRINAVLERNEQKLATCANAEGHQVKGHLGFTAYPTGARNTTSMLITPLHIMLNTGQVITISPTLKYNIGLPAFGSEENTATAIVRKISPDFATIIQDWNTKSNPPANTRSALTLGTSVTYSHSFYTDTHAKYGLYTGVEAFVEFTPTKMKSHRFMIKEAEIGIRPCIGIEARENWRFYAVFGIKASKKSVKFAALSKRITKPALEIGLGTEYIISQRYTAGFKIIKTLRQQHKLMTIPFSSTSLKILFSFGVRF